MGYRYLFRRLASMSHVLLLLFVYLLVVQLAAAKKEPVCADVTFKDPFGLDESWCIDKHEKCQEWALNEKCLTDERFMQGNCRNSCKVLCGDSVEEALEFLGEYPSDLEEDPKLMQAVRDTVTYMRKEVLVKPEFDLVRFDCTNDNADCFEWAARGECEANEKWMKENCAPACRFCEAIANRVSGRSDLEEIMSPEYWLDIAKTAGANLSINGSNNKKRKLKVVPQTEERTKALRAKMIHDGYVHLTDWIEISDNVFESYITEFRKVVVEIADKRKLLPQFLLAYDEAWEVVNALTSALEPLFGLTLAHDFYVFNVKPGAEGTVMHRDRSEEDWKIQFQAEEPYEDQPVYTTVWLALTNANQTTSSMFILPAHADYDYRKYTDDPENFVESDEDMEQVVIDNYRNIRPLPAKTGTALAWSQRALHWSSAPPHDAPHARQTLTFAMAKPDIEAPMIKHQDKSTPPPFEARIVVIVYCAISYHYQFYAQEDHTLLKFIRILANETFADHLTDEALSPATNRTLGSQFLECLEEFYEDEDFNGVLQEPIEKLAHYIVVQRGLEGTEFLKWLVREKVTAEET